MSRDQVEADWLLFPYGHSARLALVCTPLAVDDVLGKAGE